MRTDPLKRPPTQPVQVTAGRVELDGDLTVPDGAIGVVLFAHGSGSSRHSPRNQMVARALQEAGLKTLYQGWLAPAGERRARHSVPATIVPHR